MALVPLLEGVVAAAVSLAIEFFISGVRETSSRAAASSFSSPFAPDLYSFLAFILLPPTPLPSLRNQTLSLSLALFVPSALLSSFDFHVSKTSADVTTSRRRSCACQCRERRGGNEGREKGKLQPAM